MVGHSMSGRYCPQKTTSSADMEHALQAVDQGGPRDLKSAHTMVIALGCPPELEGKIL